MNFENTRAPAPALLITSVLLAIAACGDKKPEVPPTPTADAAGQTGAAAGVPASEALTADSTTWSPEALEDLLAPVALYPDPVLAQVFVAVTNPQEVLDAGNWLIANPDLKGKALDTAAEKAGFTLNMRSVMQFPEVVDKLCMNMPWTEELGQAYVNDQQGVMDAVQRLRAQAKDVGTLQSSPQMKVSTQKDPEGDVIMLEPANPNVVSVPAYDPVVVYAPQTVVAAPVAPAAPATTTTTTTTTSDDDDDGHSTGSLVTTGLLAFGAGLLVSEVFDDDDDYYNNGYYGNMYHGGMPYYPPAPYRPAYGGGYYPGNSYNRPNNYVRGGNTVIVNQNNNYYDRYNSSNGARQARNSPQSPITKAKPGRNDLNQLNAKAKQGPERRAPSTSEAFSGKGGYAGNNPQVRQTMDKQAAKGAATAKQNASGSRVQGSYAGAKPGAAPAARPATAATRAPAPKVQGSYAGAKPSRPTQASAPRPASQQASAPRPAAQQANRANTDRGYASGAGSTASRAPSAQRQAAPTAAPRPAQAQRPPPQPSRSAVSSGGGGNADRAASSRGKKSMPSGGASKSRSKSKKNR